MRFSEAIMWGDNLIRATLKHREASLKDFVRVGGNPELYKAIQDSKVGYIKITKVSSNGGYLSSGESEEGITAAFGEGLSLYIADSGIEHLLSRRFTGIKVNLPLSIQDISSNLKRLIIILFLKN